MSFINRVSTSDYSPSFNFLLLKTTYIFHKNRPRSISLFAKNYNYLYFCAFNFAAVQQFIELIVGINNGAGKDRNCEDREQNKQASHFFETPRRAFEEGSWALCAVWCWNRPHHFLMHWKIDRILQWINQVPPRLSLISVFLIIYFPIIRFFVYFIYCSITLEVFEFFFPPSFHTFFLVARYMLISI